MPTFIDFVDALIYGPASANGLSGAHANHRAFVLSRYPTADSAGAATWAATDGDTWAAHYLDQLLPRFEAWRTGEGLPPIELWDGTRIKIWEASAALRGVPLPADLSFPLSPTPTATQLNTRLRARYEAVRAEALDIGNAGSSSAPTLELEQGALVKAPYSFRFWAFLAWSQAVRANPTAATAPASSAPVLDRDGTILSFVEFLDYFNRGHMSWHDMPGGQTEWSRPTLGAQVGAGVPGFDTGLAQIRRSKLTPLGQPGGGELFRYHRDHIRLFNRWWARLGQPWVGQRNFRYGWPRKEHVTEGISTQEHAGGAPIDPATWAEPDLTAAPINRPWVNSSLENDAGLFSFTNLQQMVARPVASPPWGFETPPSAGTQGDHGMGHRWNADVTPQDMNQFTPRFTLWHEWVDFQWWWREPRFATWDDTTRTRSRVFEFVTAGGTAIPGQVVAVLDAGGTTSPANAFGPGFVPATGAGSLQVRMVVTEARDRVCRVTLRVRVFSSNPASSADVTVEATPAAGPFTDSFLVGPTGTAVSALGAAFTRTLTLSGGLQVGSPGGAGTVGFTNCLVRVEGTIETGTMSGATFTPSDPNFVHRDAVDLQLVRDGMAPDVQLALGTTLFSEAALQALATPAVDAALTVMVQDRGGTDATGADYALSFPAETLPEIRPLLTPTWWVSGLSTAVADAPVITVSPAVPGLSFVPVGPPTLEDASLHPHLPQRHTWTYRAVFTETAGSLDAFAGIALGGSQSLTLTVTARDRAGNQGTTAGTITLRRSGNAFLTDGSPSWLSADTRTFKVFAGASRLGVTLSSTPLAFIQAVLTRLNDPATTTAFTEFDALPADQASSALEAAATADDDADPATPEKAVHNFVVARVRLANEDGAADVRAFFRLYRYTSTNLVYNPDTGYRTHDAGDGRKVPLLGWDGTGAGAQLISVPCFATARVATAMTDQTDPPNVQSFPAGGAGERYRYFGAWLDINDPAAMFPTSRPSSGVDGPFTGSSFPFSQIVLDAHQCLVVELVQDADPTALGATPSSSDNLAQRNLAITNSDNPGAPVTHTVQHSFLLDLGNRLAWDPAKPGEAEGPPAKDFRWRLPVPTPLPTDAPPPEGHVLGHTGLVGAAAPTDDADHGAHDHGAHEHGAHDHGAGATVTAAPPTPGAPPIPAAPPTPAAPPAHDHGAHDHGAHDHGATPGVAGEVHRHVTTPRPGAECCLNPAPRPALRWINEYTREHLVRHRMAALAPCSTMGHRYMTWGEATEAMAGAAEVIDEQWPLVLAGGAWSWRGDLFDELAIDWGGLPEGSWAELSLPGVDCAAILNLRAMRHAPATVRLLDRHRLRLEVGGISYVPLPPTPDDQVRGVLTVHLPEGVKAGQRWGVKVAQLRGGEARVVGGFTVDVQVHHARDFAAAERRQLVLMHRRVAAMPAADPWRPVLRERLTHLRTRAEALSLSAGQPWVDPTVRPDPTAPGGVRPLVGERIRVVLERLRVLDDREPWFKGAGEFRFHTRVWTPDNGGQERRLGLPGPQDHFQLSNRPGRDTVRAGLVIFEGWVADRLAVEVGGVELDLLDPDDPLATYRRVFRGPPASWLGALGPFDESIDPEHLGGWQLWYRIERA